MRLRRRRGKYERLFCERVLRDRSRWPARTQEDCDEGGYWFDFEAAHRITEFFEKYARHYKGEWAGQPIRLESWQKLRLREAFGWRRKDGTRRFREGYNEVPRKNGKSTEAAGVGNYMLTADGEAGAEVYSAATKRDQAKIIWDAAAQMVKRSPVLKNTVGVRIRRTNLSVEATASKFEPLGADSDTLDGLNPHCGLVDETHAHKDRGVYDVIKTAFGSRRQPLMWEVTTAGVYDPTKIGWELHDFAVKVLEGAVPAEWFFAYIACADEEDDWQHPDTWKKANPNYGVSVKPGYLQEQAERAKAAPSFENTFRRLHLNQWTEQVERWLPMDRWNACAGQGDFSGQAFGGLDLASKIDVAAFVIYFEDSGDLLCRFWVPEAAVVEAERQGRVPYGAWVRDGHLIATPGDVIDYEFVESEVLELAEEHDVRLIGFDPWNAESTQQRLSAEGQNMVELRQGIATMGEATKEFERLVISKQIKHGGHPVLKWMASNIAVREDSNGNFKPDRERSGGKIDGIVAAIMALKASMLEREMSSPYNEREVLVL